MPRGSTSPPLETIAKPSPKRKREDPGTTTPPLQIDVRRAYELDEGPDASSPRTTIAHRLDCLDIHPGRSSSLETPELDRSPRKRLKYVSHMYDAAAMTLPVSGDQIDDVPSEDRHGGYNAVYSGSPSPPGSGRTLIFDRERSEVTENSTGRLEAPHRPPLSPRYLQGPDYIHETSNALSSTEVSPAQPRTLSPHPPAASYLHTIDALTDRAVSPTRTPDPSPFDQAMLTWQEDEITGQDIDVANPDDDGEGINGIGFKPTPALAHARNQKRKQQVNEYKAREAREARQRRMDRRRGLGNGFSRKSVPKRTVRFVGEA